MSPVDTSKLERNTWIRDHGSDFLKEALLAGINLDVQYYFELVDKVIWDLKIDNLEVRKAQSTGFTLGYSDIINPSNVSLEQLKLFNHIKSSQDWEALGCEIKLQRDGVQFNMDPPNIHILFYRTGRLTCTINLGANELEVEKVHSTQEGNPYTWKSVCAYLGQSLSTG